MAQVRTLKERTVSFYEIIVDEDGRQRRVAQFPWDDALAALANADLDDRTFETVSTFVGSVVASKGQGHLLLHRVKNAGEWLSVLNWDTGEWRELEARAREGFLETSVICILPFGNVVGLMQGSISAPTHKSLETWLNGIKIFPTAQLVVRPVMSRAEIERLQAAEGASRVEIRIGGSSGGDLRQRKGRLANFLKMAAEEYGDVDVTVVISVPRGKSRRVEQRRLLEDLRDLEEIMPEAAARAKAKLIYAESAGPEYSRLVELVEHHITAKAQVPALDETGKSIRILSAVGAILDVAAEHEDELRLAAGAG